jgi:hypothetical protein
MTEPHADHINRLNEFVRRMNEVERDLSHPTIRPKDDRATDRHACGFR